MSIISSNFTLLSSQSQRHHDRLLFFLVTKSSITSKNSTSKNVKNKTWMDRRKFIILPEYHSLPLSLHIETITLHDRHSLSRPIQEPQYLPTSSNSFGNEISLPKLCWRWSEARERMEEMKGLLWDEKQPEEITDLLWGHERNQWENRLQWEIPNKKDGTLE